MRSFYVTVFLTTNLVFLHCNAYTSDASTQAQANALRDILSGTLGSIAGLDLIVQKYTSFLTDKSQATLLPLDGIRIVEDLANMIGKLMQNRTDIVMNATRYAEFMASNYTYQPDLSGVEYHNMQTVVPDSNWTYMGKFQQPVNTNHSAVQIPIEIFDGGPDIQNDLLWTSELDTVWKETFAADADVLYQYFCTDSGIYRVYPEKQWQSEGVVDTYDCRSRTWFIQGASSPKDMLILMDTSGSSEGQSLNLMKYTAYALLDTLAENDYINVARFSSDASIVGCFESLVLASYRNKQKLKDEISAVQASGMADYDVGFNFAFDLLQQFNYTGRKEDDGDGAQCNRMIMLLTDNTISLTPDILKKYNADKQVRIFIFVIGSGVHPPPSIKQMACANRGYASFIPAIGAIGSAVNDPLQVLARPIGALGVVSNQWSFPFNSRLGLGMVLATTMPVYDRTPGENNQMLVGVIGTDLKIAELDDMMPVRQLGPNGYGFVILAVGYLISHPELIAKYGWLDNPPVFDLLEIEYDCPEKEAVRTLIVNATTAGSASVTAFVNVPDKRHADNKTRIYYYAPIVLSNRFRVSIVLPDYWTMYVANVTAMPVSEGLSYLQTNESAVLLAQWRFCKRVPPANEASSWHDDLLYTIANNYSQCDPDAVQQLFYDAKLTSDMNLYWSQLGIESSVSTIRGVFVATNNGLTRVYPASVRADFAAMTYIWNETYYQRALDNSDLWIFSASYVPADSRQSGVNSSTWVNDMQPATAVVMAAKAIIVSVNDNQTYMPAVTGLLLTYDFFMNLINQSSSQCFGGEITCYLLDDGAYVIASSDAEDEFKTGRFFGDPQVEPLIMTVLNDKEVYLQKSGYDYQAICQPQPARKASSVARLKSVFLPFLYDLLTFSWWMTKVSWFYNMGLFQWMFSSQQLSVDSQAVAPPVNESCVMELSQYYFGPMTTIQYNVTCGTCKRRVSTAPVAYTNLLLVRVTRDCGDCAKTFPSPAPHIVPDIYATNNCTVVDRFRIRNPCVDYSPHEAICSGSKLVPSLLLITMVTMLVWWHRANH